MFLEVVASAGPISEARRSALMAVAAEGGFGESQVAFVTAYADRDDSEFKRSVSALASFLRVVRLGAGTRRCPASGRRSRATAAVGPDGMIGA